MYESLIGLIRSIYGDGARIGLHEPRFGDREKRLVLSAIESTYVSTSFSPFVEQLEKQIAAYTGSAHAVATVNGTSALHVLMYALGLGPEDEVLTQSFGFVATSNAIRYVGAHPVFIDIEPATLGMSVDALHKYLDVNAVNTGDGAVNRTTGRRIKACVPVHIFGHPLAIDEIIELCDSYQIQVIEDAAEALGSRYNGRSAGTFGTAGVLSFNGNKIVTAGGGGMILTASRDLAQRLKHLTTTAKTDNAWHFEHDEIGFNYRMPNLNAALGCAQMEQLDEFIMQKREIARRYLEWARLNGATVMREPAGCRSNYWLNTIICDDQGQRDLLLASLNQAGINARPAWRPMHMLPMYAGVDSGDMSTTESMYSRVVNLPSSAR